MDLVRLAHPDDAEQIAAIYAPFVRDRHTSFETEPPDAAEMARRISGTLRTHPWLVWDRDGAVLAYLYAASHRPRAAYQWSVETTIYVKDGMRRSGIGRKLYEALFRVLELQRFQVAYAGVALPNPASVGLHEALGFVPVGVYRAAGFKHGRWHDVGWWQRLIRPLEPAPSPPVPLAEIRETDAFRSVLSVGL